MKKIHILHSILFVSVVGLSVPVFAAEQHGSHSSHDMAKGEHAHKQGKEGHAMPAWAKTLTKEQKKQVDEMHHELDAKQKVLKEEETLKQQQLNALTVMENADQAKINQAIDELMQVKNKILRNRYQHLVEMRVILTKEQKISYDEAIMKRDKIK